MVKKVQFNKQINEDGEQDMRAEITTQEDAFEAELAGVEEQQAPSEEMPKEEAIEVVKEEAPKKQKKKEVSKSEPTAIDLLKEMAPLLKKKKAEDHLHQDFEMHRIHFQLLHEMLEMLDKGKTLNLSDGSKEMISKNYALLKSKGAI